MKIKKQSAKIAKLKSTLQCYKKRLQRILRKKATHTPISKVTALIDSQNDREIVKKKMLFSEVLSRQLEDNFSIFF